MKLLNYLIVTSVLLYSCSEKPETQEGEDVKITEENGQSLESMAKRHVESKLGMPATEKYTMKIYREDLDGDEKQDAIITVNRLAFAIEEADKMGRTAKKAEIGFMGNYNFIFYYDGGLDLISPPMVIPSSAYAPLEISFANITSDAYKDILIDFRIMNAGYRDFFSVHNHSPQRMFQWKNYDGLGENESEAYVFDYAEGTMGPSKDILVKKAKIKQPDGKIDIYKWPMELEPTDEVAYRFFFHPSQGKYVTLKN